MKAIVWLVGHRWVSPATDCRSEVILYRCLQGN